jgi:chemotaxis protein histidine kinase CheA
LQSGLPESLNGTIAFKGQKGKGTKFIIRLPSPQLR